MPRVEFMKCASACFVFSSEPWKSSRQLLKLLEEEFIKGHRDAVVLRIDRSPFESQYFRVKIKKIRKQCSTR